MYNKLAYVFNFYIPNPKTALESQQSGVFVTIPCYRIGGAIALPALLNLT